MWLQSMNKTHCCERGYLNNTGSVDSLTSGLLDNVPNDFFDAGAAPTLDPIPAFLEMECSGVNAAVVPPNTSAAAAGRAAKNQQRAG